MARALSAKRQHLAAVPLFAHCTARQLARIDRVADEVEVPAGTRVITRGRLGREFFILQRGAASVRRDGHEIATLRAGDSAGELSLLGTAAARTADVVATEDCRLIVIDAREFRAILLEDPRISLRLLETVAGWLKAGAGEPPVAGPPVAG